MPDEYILLFLAAAVYLFDCARWWRSDVVVFRAWLGGRFHTTAPGKQLGNDSGGFVWGNPFPPLGTMIGSIGWPVAVSPEGVCGVNPQVFHRAGHAPSTGLHLPWSAVRELVRNDRTLAAGDQVLVVLPSRRAAQIWHRRLLQLAQGDDELERAAAVEKMLRETLDDAAVGERLGLFRSSARVLRLCCNALLIFIVTAVYQLLWVEEARHAWPSWLAGLLGLMAATAWFYVGAHRRLYHGLPATAPWGHAALMLVSPLTTVRGVDALSAEAAMEFHPVAVARRLLDGKSFHRFLRHVLLDLTYPLQPTGEPPPIAAEAESIVAWCRDRQWKYLAGVVEQLGLRLDTVLAPPHPDSHEVHAYCPRCHEQYVTAEEECPACPGIRRKSF